MRHHRRFFTVFATTACALWLLSSAAATAPPSDAGRQPAAAGAEQTFKLPNREGSLKFFVLGDFGSGDREQYEVGDRMAEVQSVFAVDLVITVGDNIYGGERPQDFRKKFEDPYKRLLGAGVKFYASLGNHDSREQAHFDLFNMGGRTYYTHKPSKQSAKFIALESDYPTPRQIEWVQSELEGGEDWMIPYFHHPLYSSGMHGSHSDLGAVLEPMFLKSAVTVVFTGHDHFYERIKPQKGITHFVVGSGGQLRRGDINRRSGLTAVGFDTDRAFLAVEIDKNELFFSAISRTGQVIDSGVIARRPPAP